MSPMTKALLCAVATSLIAASTSLGAKPPALAVKSAAGDAVRGKTLFLQCRACHTVGDGEASNVGPNLWNVLGAKAASKPDFKYSAALTASGLVWSPGVLDHWLEKPTGLVPGTTMAFAGVGAPRARADLIAYLATLAPGKPAH